MYGADMADFFDFFDKCHNLYQEMSHEAHKGTEE
jgi:hypothetical protein